MRFQWNLRSCFCLCLALLGLATCARGQDLPLKDILIPGEGWELVAEGMKFTEGPACDPKGRLFFTDVPESKVYRLNDQGKAELLQSNSQRTNGLMFGPDGKLYGCRNGAKEIALIHADGKATVRAAGAASNDLVIAPNGDIYFTDFGNKRVWLAPAEGKPRVVAENIERPNGIILWPDGKTLVVADTSGPHLWTFRVEQDGSLAHRQPYSTLRLLPGQSASGADGMTVDRTGRLYVATNAGIQVFDTQGRLSGIIHKPQRRFLSNICFGGEGFSTLYATCSDKVFARKLKAKGYQVSHSKK